MSRILDLSAKLNQALISESVTQSDSSLILAGLMSLNSSDDLVDGKDHLYLSGNQQPTMQDFE